MDNNKRDKFVNEQMRDIISYCPTLNEEQMRLISIIVNHAYLRGEQEALLSIVERIDEFAIGALERAIDETIS